MSSSKKIEEAKKQAIDVVTFVNNYIGIYNKSINKKTTHKAIKQIFPYIRRTSFDKLSKNMEDFYKGNVVIVKDCTGNCVPYLNPKINVVSNIQIEEEPIYNEKFTFDYDLDEMDLYELIELKKKCVLLKKRKEYNKLIRVISTKVDHCSKVHKLNKEKLIIKERREDYD